MPKLTPAQQKERSNAILAAAERCFLRHGFHKTTMQDICKEAGVSAGAIYVYFRSKEALVAGLAEAEQQDILARFSSLGQEADVFSALLALMLNCVKDQSQQRTALLLEIIAESTRNAELAAILHRVDAAIKLKVGQFLQAMPLFAGASPQAIERVRTLLPVLIDGMMLRKAIDPHFAPDIVAQDLVETLRKMSLAMPPKSDSTPAPQPRSTKTPQPRSAKDILLAG